MKKCNMCGTEKPLSSFQFRNDNQKFRSECKECKAKRDKNYYEQNKERVLRVAKKYYENNRERLLQYASEHSDERKNRRRFGGNKYLVLERDNYTCQLCGSKEKLLVHHKDEENHTKNIPNHDIANLQTLCRGCHTSIHHKLYDGCKIEGCEKKHHAHGYCSKHYHIYYRKPKEMNERKLEQRGKPDKNG